MLTEEKMKAIPNQEGRNWQVIMVPGEAGSSKSLACMKCGISVVEQRNVYSGNTFTKENPA